MVTPQTMVALAPMVAPRSTRVLDSPPGPFLRWARGVRSLVKIMLGPRKTSSDTVTPSQMRTAFLMVTRSPILAPPSTNAVTDVAIGADHRTVEHMREGPDPGSVSDAVALAQPVGVDEGTQRHAFTSCSTTASCWASVRCGNIGSEII